MREELRLPIHEGEAKVTYTRGRSYGYLCMREVPLAPPSGIGNLSYFLMYM
jgi:hypothetical protein